MLWYDIGMKLVIEVDDLCCKKCATRAERELMLMDGVSAARSVYEKNIILVETTLPEAPLRECLEEMGLQVTKIRPRKGIFG